MLDFSNRRSWLLTKLVELKRSGLVTSVKFGSQTDHKPGVVIEITGRVAMGVFEAWVAGEADYSIFMPPSRKADMAANRWGLELTVENFEEMFDKFVTEYRRHEFCAESSKA
jgi:hypothetical protein